MSSRRAVVCSVLRVLAASTLMTCVGCASTVQATDAGATADLPVVSAGPVPIEGYVSAAVGAMCDGLFACRRPSSTDAEERAYWGSAANCRRMLRRYPWSSAHLSNPWRLLHDAVRSVGLGLQRYDPAAARRCVDRLASSCLDFDDRSLNPCPEAFSGAVAAGGACWRDDECSADLWCDAEGQGVCPGTCRARLPLGSACAGSAQQQRCSGAGLVGVPGCVEPASLEGQRSCYDLRTAAAAPSGAPCGFRRDEAAHVITSTGCASGLWCRRGPAGFENLAGTCLPLRAPGERCDANEGRSCPVDLHCTGRAGEPATCRAVDPPRGAGTSCEDMPCDPGSFCDRATATCRPQWAAGQRCDPGQDAQCASGLCSRTAAVCLPRLCPVLTLSGPGGR